MENDEILTVSELCSFLKLAEKTAYRLASEGKIPAFKIGGSWRFSKNDILKWIEEQKTSSKRYSLDNKDLSINSPEEPKL